ncbi:MAG: ChaN family lipoprotein [Gammaproteobacteria bacterium]|nr:ChaN family lipoprotein [Gammaproteobacteria bacterium]
MTMKISRSLLMMCLCTLLASAAMANGDADTCDSRVARWLDPASGESITAGRLFDRLARKRVVLLGEEHTTEEHHRWQAYVLAALHSRIPDMVVGFEMLPRRAQPVLDAWSAGSLSEEALLKRSDWTGVWGYDAGLYLPLFHFARLNRLPTVALNVDRELVSLVGSRGWQALTVAQRGGLSDPAPASDGYLESLARLHAFKQSLGRGHGHASVEEPSPEELQEIQSSETFRNFVDAQLTWDRAMAEALAVAYRRDPGALVVGIVGRGHLEYGYGIPHQLADLGVDDVAVLLPITEAAVCDGLDRELATAVFVLDAPPADESAAGRPLLGVRIETVEQGVRVLEVVAGSVAERAGIRSADVILSAAGFATESTSALIEIVSRQAPGTWLPLRVGREGQLDELIAKFPQRFATP